MSPAVSVSMTLPLGLAPAVLNDYIDLSIGGRFQLAKTLCNIGQAYSRVGDMPRAKAYLKRARDAHERYGDQDGRAETLVVSADDGFAACAIGRSTHSGPQAAGRKPPQWPSRWPSTLWTVAAETKPAG